jgi:Flp pilus assembly protein TadB
MSNLTPGKAFGLSLLAFLAVVIVVVLLWHTLGTWLAVIILIAAVVAICWPLFAIARRS